MAKITKKNRGSDLEMIEEKAIERCEQLIKPDHANWIGISNQKAIRELLNKLKEKDKEIEFQKDINKIEKDRHKKTEKSLKGQIIKNNKIIEKLEKEAQGYFETTIIQSEQFSKELKEKDKEIDLMAEHIQNGCDFDNRIKTKQEIKQYFKSKAEKE